MKKSIHLIIAIAVTVIALGAVLYILRKPVKHEGFDGTVLTTVATPEHTAQVPSASESSSLPNDVAGATSSNPQIALAAPKDIEAISDKLQTFKTLVAQKDPATTDLSQGLIHQAQEYQANIPVLENQLKSAYSNPDLTGMTSDKSNTLLQTLSSLIQALSAAHVIRGAASTIPAQNMDHQNVAYIAGMPQPTLVATPVEQVTLQDLIHLRDRINEESLRLANLRTSAPTMLARQNQLEDLAGNLTNMIADVQRGTKAIQDVPITKDDADNFMKALAMNEKTLPALHIPMGQTNATATNMPLHSMQQQVPPIQQLLDKAQYMKWSLQVKLSYDPADAHRDNVLKRLESIERSLTNFAISETPLPDSIVHALKTEMQVLQESISKKGAAVKAQKAGRPITDYNAVRANNTLNVSNPENPAAENLNNAQDTGFPEVGYPDEFPKGEVSPDVYVRPGFAMNDDTIARRASASAFDPSTVGGPDWKKRSLDLCRQVGAANLGEPANFGCIANPTEVGPNYSWKGNYTMVCNRLGDTWGAWYPDMFGCPKYDPQQKFKGTMM